VLILLTCPFCNHNLQGENNSKIFFCAECHLAFDMDEDPPKSFPIFYIEPKIKQDNPQVFFPFWRILSEYRIIESEGSPLSPQKKFLYVPAFFIKNISFFGDIGYYMTFKDIILETTGKKNLAIFPADRSLNDCLAYPLIYLLQEETRGKKRKKPLDITIDHKDISMVMISFYKMNGDYQDSILSWRYPSGALI
jgi:uncharacterized protein YbaR (Trm112 family)